MFGVSPFFNIKGKSIVDIVLYDIDNMDESGRMQIVFPQKDITEHEIKSEVIKFMGNEKICTDCGEELFELKPIHSIEQLIDAGPEKRRTCPHCDQAIIAYLRMRIKSIGGDPWLNGE